MVTPTRPERAWRPSRRHPRLWCVRVRLLMFVFLAGMALPPSLPAAPTAMASERIRVNGREYVRLASIRREYGVEVNWIQKEKKLAVTGKTARVVLNVGSRECDINGVSVWLLYPLLMREGMVYLAQVDLLHTFSPILRPPRNPQGTKIRTICIDPGHGGSDPGYLANPNPEKAYTLLLAKELRNQLTDAGYKVVMTRTADVALDLDRRPALANQARPDLFLSLHFNASQSARAEAKGVEVYSLTPAGAPSTNARGEGSGEGSCVGNRNNDKNLALAFQIQKAMVNRLRAEDRGVRRARFAVLRDATMPAVLIEAGFLSHPVEGKKILQSSYRREMARSILTGIENYKRLVGG